MKALNKFSPFIILIIFLCSCQSKEEKRKLEVSDKAYYIFYTALLELKEHDKKINFDSLSTIYKQLRAKNVDTALTYAYEFKKYTTLRIANIETVKDSLYKIRQVKLDKEQVIQDANWFKSKAGKIQKKHPIWSSTDCILLSQGRYWIGMSYDMLIYLRGRPNHVNPSNYGDGVIYQWCWDDHTPSCFYGGSDGIITSYN